MTALHTAQQEVQRWERTLAARKERAKTAKAEADRIVERRQTAVENAQRQLGAAQQRLGRLEAKQEKKAA